MDQVRLMSQDLSKLSLCKHESLKINIGGNLSSDQKHVPNSSSKIFCQKVLSQFYDSGKKEEVESSSGVSYSEMMSEASKASQ